MNRLITKLIVYTLAITLVVGGGLYYKYKDFVQKDLGVYALYEQSIEVGGVSEIEEVEVTYRKLPKFSDKLDYSTIINKDSVGRTDPFNQLYITEQDMEDLKKIEEKRQKETATQNEDEGYYDDDYIFDDSIDWDSDVEIITDFNELFNN